MSHLRAFWSSGLVALFLIIFSSGLAYSQTSSLSGVVTDPQGNAVSGANIIVLNPAKGFSRTVTTAKDGAYLVAQLPPDTYKVRTEAAGFANVESEVIVAVDTRTTLNITLKIGDVKETVVVQGGETVLNTSDATIGNSFNEQQIKLLPLLANNVVNLLSLQTGAVFVPGNVAGIDPRNGAISGARSDQTNVTLDGVDVNDPQNSQAYYSGLRMTSEALQEFRVTTTNYGANQGRSSSAQVSLVTRSGTNDYHGAAYWSHRNTATSANEFFNKTTQLESGRENKPPKLNWHVFGASGSAPIIKDRWFIFANYEGFRQTSEAVVNRNVPSMLLRNGYFQYRCATTAQCPASTVTIGGRSFAVPEGVRALTPAEVTSLDPLGIGPNAAALDHFKKYPEPNTPGRDGLNLVGYLFTAGIKDSTNVGIVRTDFNVDRDAKHKLLWRGILQDDVFNSSPQFPGQPSNTVTLINPKGSSIGYDAVLSPTLTNSFRYGYTRLKDEIAGLQQQSQVAFRFIDNLPALSVSQGRTIPTHNIVDDVTWVKGGHTLGGGINFRFTRIPRYSNANSFNEATTNASWLLGVGRRTAPGQAACTLPACSTLPAATSLAIWADGFTPLLGLITQVDGNYNYDKTGKLLPEGEPVRRRYATNEFEWYLQDQWRATNSLTITAGVRYSLLPPPWETNGLQVRPTPSFGDMFELRRSNMLRGIPNYDGPRFSFDLAGKANGRKGFYDTDFNNWSPRIAVAWSPRSENSLLKKAFGNGQTTFRFGYSLVYDRIGHGLATSFDNSGSFGLSTNLTNPSSTQTELIAPRFAGLYNFPKNNLAGDPILLPAPAGGFPQTPELGLLAISTSIDDTLTTPRAHTINFSIGRELPKNFTVEAAYVGRLGRDLLTRRDLAMPLNIVDPKSGMDYFSAATALARLIETGTPVSQVRPIPYWENLFPTAGANGGNGLTSTQEFFLLYRDVAPDYTTALFIFDAFCFPACFGATASNPLGNPYAYFTDQYSSLAGLSTIGYSNYHSLQLSLRKRFSAGTQFDFNYTLSKSLDLTSDVERGAVFSNTGFGGYSSFIINSWNPDIQYAQSDFDVRHQINANWLVELPFGKNKPLGGNSPGWLNQIIGGWATTGIFRWTSGLPANIINCRSCWATNWNLQGNAELAAGKTYPVTGTNKGYKFPDGKVRPSIFPDPSVAVQSLRLAYPGETGFRNQIRGDGIFQIDFGLIKEFKIYESHKLRFQWQIFNLTNTVRFDTNSLTVLPDILSTFGQYSSTLGTPRVMQFALRYEF
jgi:hypothetical protein